MDPSRLIGKNNSKTDCPTWSISTESCAFKKGDICSNCYAQKGRYLFWEVKRCISDRWEWWKRSKFQEKTLILKSLIRSYNNEYFRVFESGDFDSINSIRAWINICSDLNNVKFWIPTKTWNIDKFKKYLIILNKLDNVVVRPSAINFNSKSPFVKGLSHGVTAHIDNPPASHIVCPGKCNKCRLCWNSKGKVSYKIH